MKGSLLFGRIQAYYPSYNPVIPVKKLVHVIQKIRNRITYSAAIKLLILSMGY
ncbi:hypothetical protein [Nafulsella turpanensis]|uniref:hypothetical protein n=1 Tax=Nafulsella turpanensis TaxID=1265690 RepID=UPI00034B2130|nr:hypothetical protein [Nafulsella turpanensis]